jgi:hypothetical protein
MRNLLLSALILASASQSAFSEVLLCPLNARTEVEIPDGKALIILQRAGGLVGEYSSLFSDGCKLEVGGVEHMIRIDAGSGVGVYINGPAKLILGPRSNSYSQGAVGVIFYEILQNQPLLYTLVPANTSKTLQVPAGKRLVVASLVSGSGGSISFLTSVSGMDVRVPVTIGTFVDGPADIVINGPTYDNAYQMAYYLENSDAPNSSLIASLAKIGILPNNLSSAISMATSNLATKTEITTAINEGKASGIASVTASPNTWSLFTTSQIQNMAVDDLVLTRQEGGGFVLNYDIEQSTDLQTWTTYAPLSLPLTGLPTDKAFVRIKVINSTPNPPLSPPTDSFATPSGSNL